MIFKKLPVYILPVFLTTLVVAQDQGNTLDHATDGTSRSVPLSGTYTIGSGADYTTIALAVSALHTNGVNGPVTFNFLSGTYTEVVTLNEITGASATNTITFQAGNGNANSVIWENTSNNYSYNYVLRLDGTDHVTLKHITFKNINSSYGRRLDLVGITDSISVDSCSFLGKENAGNTTNHSSIYGSSNEAQGLKIKNSSFTDGGSYAINLNSGNSSSSPTGLEITNNTFTNTYSGIHAQYYDAVTIRGNTISGAYMLDKGIALGYCDGANVIEDNRIYAPEMSYGLYLTYCQGTSGNEATIANNLISVEDEGITLYSNNHYQNVYYNTVKVRDQRPFYVPYHGNQYLTIKNNIFSTESSSQPAFYSYYGLSFLVSDYNDLHTGYTYPVLYYYSNKTLVQWQAAGYDSNSVTIEPFFNGDSTLVPIALSMDNLGTPLTSITDDINGLTRSTTTPDMGALEITPSVVPLSGNYTIGSGGNFATLDSLRTALLINGISGPVTFNFLAGTYSEALSLGSIPGASASNTVTFQSADTHSDSVIWENTNNNSSYNYVLRLNGTDHVALKHITFKNINSSYGRRLVLTGITDSISVDSCSFLGKENAGGSTNHSSIYGSSNEAQGLKIKNSSFTDGGSYAVTLSSGNSTSSPTGLEITNNTFTNTYSGIFAQYYDAVTIRGNTISGAYMYDKGIYLDWCDGANVIEDNRIYAPDMSYGLYLQYCQGTSGNEATIANNLITVEDDGITLHSSNYYQNVYYNTVKVRDQRPFYAYNGNQNLTIKNNIFSTESSSYPAFYSYAAVTGLVSDYNNLHTGYSYPVYYSDSKSLSDWQVLGYGANSVMIDPVFNNDSTLVPIALTMDNRGTPLTSITDDINGLTRSTSTPDLGAQEFSVSGTPLSGGTYSIGSGGDYPTLDSLRLSLMAYGISGPVTFNFLAGTYSEALSLGSIPGASTSNTVTFQSADAHSDSVIWENTNNNSSYNYVLRLNGTDHVTLKHITFKNINSSYGRKLVLTGITDSISVDSCSFLGTENAGSSANHSSIYGSSNEAQGLKIKNSTFTDGGSYAVYLNSNNPTSSPTGLEITNNTFTNTYSGIHAQYYDAVTIRGNTISGAYMVDRGIYLNFCDGANVIEDNRIYAPDMSTGLYLYYCYGTSGNEATIANNLISVEDDGINLYANNSYQNVYYNTVKVRDQRPFYAHSAIQNLTIKNNIFSTESSSYPAFYIYASSGGLVSDYNDLYTDYTYPVHYSYGNKTFDQWQSDGYDSNSVMIDPVFNNDSTLVPLALALDNLGTPLTSITDDINDVIRSTSTPDLGAQEFSVSGTPLSGGTYSVGSGGDYPTLDSLRLSLMAYGISGPVTFNFLAGTYSEALSLGSISGASASNTVTFQSADAHSDSVILENTNDNSSYNYVLELNGTDHVTLKHITFKNLEYSFGRKLVLAGITDSISVDSCSFLGKENAGNYDYHSSIYGDSNEAQGLKIKNSTFTDGGSYAINLNSGNSTSSPTGLEITNNTFTNTYSGIFAQYYDAVTIRGNTISGAYMVDRGIYLNFCGGANVIEDNRIYAPDMSTGLYLNYCHGTSGNEATIANNLISVEDDGIALTSYNYYQNVYYNTVKVRDENPFYAYSGNQNLTIKNNIFSTESSSHPAFYSYTAVSGLLVSDYNDLHTGYTYPVYYSYSNKTFDQWQTAGYDSNSVTIDPIFTNDSTLIPRSYSLDNLGTPISGIADDINGTTRSTTTPDMGAVEFTVAPVNISGSYTIGSGGDYSSIGAAIDDIYIYGLAGAVTYNILPGTYTEQIEIGDFLGSSAANTVTVQSYTGNASDVTWQYTPTSTNNYVLKINDTDHLTIKNITFDASTSSSYSTALDITGTTDSLLIQGNVFIGYDYNGNSANNYLVESNSNSGTGMVFTGNTFMEGGHGLYINDGAADDGELKVTNNVFSGQYNGIYIYNVDSVEVSGNTVTGTNSYGIYTGACRPVTVTGNKVVGSSSSNVGITIYYSTSEITERSLVANNMVNTGNTGIKTQNSSYIDIYYNTVINLGTQPTLDFYSTNYVNVKNNIITNTGTSGRLVSKGWNTYTDNDFDYNLYYGGSSSYGFYSHIPSVHGNFSAWQTAGFDSNSVFQDPDFYASGDGFHLAAGNELATPLALVTTDFDNETRDEATPDIGADEYNLANYDGVVNVPGELPTIQGAIDIAVNGDSILVAAGTYTENIDFNSKTLVMIGEDRETTIIDGNNSGRVVNISDSSVLSNFTIQNGANSTTLKGSGINASGSTVLNNLIVKNNTNEQNEGAGLFLDGSPGNSPRLTNSLVINNTGDGIVFHGVNSLISNVTITNNTIAGIFLRPSGSNAHPTVINSIIYGNLDNNQIKFHDVGGQAIEIYYSIVQEGQDSITTSTNDTLNWGTGNLDVDPLFADTASGDYRLLALSPAINAGHPDSTDSDGSRADMGGYPYLNTFVGPVWYVDSTNGSNITGTGSSFNAFANIGPAIRFAADGDSINVAAGTYVENVDFDGKNLKLVGADREATIIDGGGSGSVVTITNGETSAVLSGFTLQNGNNNKGGGILVDGTDPTLTNLIIRNNTAVDNGGGIYISNSVLLLKNSIIKDNSSVWGGGVHIENNSVPTIINVEITGNDVINGNAVYITASDPVITNSTITNNESFYDNNEKGIELYHGANVTLINSIITGQNQTPIYIAGDDPSLITISYSLIEGGQDSIINNDNGTITWGAGNIDVDPIFVDTANGDYSLQRISHLIDRGHPDSTDADGTRADIGAHYFDQSDLPGRINPRTFIESDSVTINWSTSSDATVSSYKIYRSYGSGVLDSDSNKLLDYSAATGLATVSGTSYTDGAVEPDSIYYYVISGVNASGEGVNGDFATAQMESDTAAVQTGGQLYYGLTDDETWYHGDSSFTIETSFRLITASNSTADFYSLVEAGAFSAGLVADGSGDVALKFKKNDSFLGSGTDMGSFSEGSGWHHVAVVYDADGNTANIFLDGARKYNASGQSVAVTNASFFAFGADSIDGFSVQFDNARVSQGVRYGGNFIPAMVYDADDQTIGLYRFNENRTDAAFAGQIATYDASSNGNHLHYDGTFSWSDGIPILAGPDVVLIVNEILKDPDAEGVNEFDGEWFELYNRGVVPLNLKNFTIEDDDGQFINITFDVPIDPGDYSVFTKNSNTEQNGGVESDYSYATSNFSLSNADDEISIYDGNDSLVNRVAYDDGDTFPDSSGFSMELYAPYYDNTVGSSWTNSAVTYGSGDHGTPGARNNAYSGHISASDYAFDFGGIVEGNETSNTVLIYNTGLRSLAVDSMDNALGDFVISPTSGNIPVGDSLQLLLRFVPSSPGPKYDTLKVFSQDNSNPMMSITLYGLGISSVADIVVNAAGDDSISSYEFLSTRVGFPRTEVFRIANIGNTLLDVEDIAITPTDGAFSTGVNNYSGIALYDTIDVPVLFNPPSAGAYSATLTFTSTDDDENPYVVGLSGSGSLYLTHYVPLEYSSIQAAINASVMSDTVVVDAGTYTESITFPDHNLVVRGSGAGSTILGGDTTVITFPTTGDPYTSILEDMTVNVAASQKGFLASDDYLPQFNRILFVLGADAIAGEMTSSASATMNHVTVVKSSTTGSGHSFTLDNASITINNSILWTGANAEISIANGGVATVSYSTVSDSSHVTGGNIGVDPLFTYAQGGNYSLQWPSPAIDAGNPQENDPDGTIADMGALIYNQSLQPPDIPGTVVATAGNGQATVTWSVPLDPRGNENADITSYVLYRGTGADSLVLRDTITAANTSYVDSGSDDYLQNGTTYYYFLTAVDTADLGGAASDTVNVVPAGGTLVLADTTHPFGQVVHDQSGTWNLILTNSGNGVLSVDNIATVTSYFTLSSSSAEIDPEAADTITVTFNPELMSETVYDTISIISDDLYLINSSITLSGESIWPIIGLSTTNIDYGDAPVNNSVAQNVVVHNTGLSELTLTNIYVDDATHYTISTGGLISVGPSPNDLKRPPEIPSLEGREAGKVESKNIPGIEDVRESDNRATGNISKSAILNEIVLPSDSLIITIEFVSADTGMFNSDLHIISDDPLGNDNLAVSLLAHTTKPEMQVVNTMSVVTYKGNDIPFNVNIDNTGGFALEYEVEVSANWVGFDWLTVPQSSGTVNPYSNAALTVNTASTADLDAGAYTGYLYFNTNGGSDPTQVVRTDTVEVYMNLLEDNSQITQDSVDVPAGNAEPITLLDSEGNPLGLVLDFLNSQGGTVNVTRIDATPPTSASTPFDDPSSGITDPYFARVYFEISATFSGSYAVDIGFDYSTIPGVQDASMLRIAKRSLNAGVSEEWNIISQAATNVDMDNNIVYAQNQTGFSQWALLSNTGENSFIDVSAPAIQAAVLTPSDPGALEEVTLTVIINDETGIANANLHYTQGGSETFSSLALSVTSGSSYSATIPSSDVTRNGLIYYIQAEDDLGFVSISDTIGVEVNFSSGDLSTSSALSSAYSTGFPIDKWRMISIPAKLDDYQVGNVIGDELGSQTNSTWRIFEWNDVSLSYKENPVNFSSGESYWLYQRVEDNLSLATPAGETGSMNGTSLTIKPGWNLIGSPYSFPVDLIVDQGQFYGPVAYGLSGESWSDVTAELRPWSGYALYNRTTGDQTVVIDPVSSTTGLLARQEVNTDGWVGNLEAQAGYFADRHNKFGQLTTAEDGVDHHDNPEIVAPEAYLSITFVQDGKIGKFTSDMRSFNQELQVWEAHIVGQEINEPVTLNWSFPQPAEANTEIILLDNLNRKTMAMDEGQQLELGMISERFPRKVHIVAGPTELVQAALRDLLAAIPEKFTLYQNYPNPFNPTTTLRFGLPQPSNIEFRIINILGQEVATVFSGWQDMGFYEYRWSGMNALGQQVSNGVYFAVLTNGRAVKVRKMLLLK